jgi:hypothetical protein
VSNKQQNRLKNNFCLKSKLVILKRKTWHRLFLSDNEYSVSRSPEQRDSYYFYLVTFDGRGEPKELLPILAAERFGGAMISPSSYTARFDIGLFEETARMIATSSDHRHGDPVAGFQRFHRVRPGSPRPQAHQHDADLRQAAALSAGFVLAQGADLRDAESLMHISTTTPLYPSIPGTSAIEQNIRTDAIRCRLSYLA